MAKLQPKEGDLLVLTLPHGLGGMEIQRISELLSELVVSTGSSVLVLMPGASLEQVSDTRMDWLATAGLALRGYTVPKADGKPRPTDERRYRVLHPEHGQLSDHALWLEAIQLAREKLSSRRGDPSDR
jgi:hypothetical protein